MNRGYSIENVMTKKFDLLPFSGKWQKSFGNPAKEFSAMIWGESSNGKTDLCLQLALYLTNFGNVAYNSMEEGLSYTFQQALSRHETENLKNKFILLDREPWPDMVKRMKKHKSPQFLIVDSVQYAGIDRRQYKALKEFMKQKNKALIFLSHANGKQPKGALADFIRYDVDIKIWVEGFKAFPEGRINTDETPEPFVIWQKGADKYFANLN